MRNQCWLTSLTNRHSSPITQAFIKPFSLPWIILTDPHESQDILQRRTKDFDRSGFFGEVIGGILPEQHIQFLSTDARFKTNRNLINHLMAPTFIREVSAPEVYKSIQTLVKVWKRKCKVAKGRPFEAHGDITHAALDAIFASTFGLEEGESITIRRRDAIAEYAPDLSEDMDEPITFPEGKIPEIFSAVLTLANSVTDTQLSPLPVLTSWVLRKLPYMKRATTIKDAYIHDKVEESINLINSSQLVQQGESKPRSAMHSVLLREKEVAEKECRRPSYHSRAIADEFFGFMLAGHDTTATTVSWGVKYLTTNPHIQSTLRDALYAAFPSALLESRAPSYAELSKASVPYLDATVEEILRHANTIAFVARQALHDTTVLGHHVPKGTDVFLMANGAGYLEPNIPLCSNDVRSPGANPTNKAPLTPLWPDTAIREFAPERWLRSDGSFDANAGPTLAFGLGPRACFGKRLAVQALRMEFALLVWEFVFERVPEGLGGFEGVQRFAREPVQCYVRLSRAA
jgi:cytochrome P450